MPTLRDEIKAA
jgi:hypothetical protein